MSNTYLTGIRIATGSYPDKIPLTPGARILRVDIPALWK
jgi:hypothetical protein